MILVDFSGVAYAAIHMSAKEKGFYDINLARLFAINSILMYKKRFSQDYGEMILCCDSSNSWRKREFTLYKKNREIVATPEGVEVHNQFMNILTEIKEDFKKHIPFSTLAVDNMEGDDIIYIMSKLYPDEDHIVITNDKDLKQMINDRISVYLAVKKELVEEKIDLLDHILKGDQTDGIPNILSDDDTFIEKDKKQKPLTKKLIAEAKVDIDAFVNKYSVEGNFRRNRICIDLSEIPQHFYEKVKECYKEQLTKSTKVYDFLQAKKLVSLYERVAEFREILK